MARGIALSVSWERVERERKHGAPAVFDSEIYKALVSPALLTPGITLILHPKSCLYSDSLLVRVLD